MTKTAIVLVAAIAGTAFADVNLSTVDRSGYSMMDAQGVALDGAANLGTTTTFYENIAGPYAAFPPSDVNPLGVGDYQSVATNNINMTEFVFVGGVDTVGAVVFFDFFDAGGNFMDGFGVALPDAGNFIWTITTDLEVAAGGFVSMDIDDGTNGPAGLGQWFLTTTAAAIGDAGIEDVGGGNNFTFSIGGTEVPAPGALALVGLGGMVATRRRR